MKKLFLSASLFLCFYGSVIAAPVFIDLDVNSDNPDPTLAQGTNTLSFDLTLTGAETGTGTVAFTIGSDPAVLNANFPANGPSTTHTANYTLTGTENGIIAIQNIFFQSSDDWSIISGLPAFPYTPDPNVTVDNVAPVFTSLPLANDAFDEYINAAEQSSTNPMAILNASGYDSVAYAIEANTDACDGSVPYNFGSIPTPQDTISLSDGDYKICVRLSDNAGNITYGASNPFFVLDATGPSITSFPLANEAADGYINDTESSSTNPVAILNATGFDTQAFSLEPELTVCDVSVTYNLGTIPTPSSISVPDGSYKVCVKLTDTAGNITYGATNTFFILDTTYPVITSFPLANEAIDGYINAVESTSTNPVAILNASGYDQDDYSVQLSTDTCDGTIPYTYADIPTPASLSVPEDTYKVCVRLSDDAGNRIYNETDDFYVLDTTGPSISSITLENTATDGYVNAMERNDTNPLISVTGSGHDETRYAVITATDACNASTTGFITTAPNATALTTDGDYRVCVELSDLAGNPNAYDTSTVITRDTVYPVLDPGNPTMVSGNGNPDTHYLRAGKQVTYLVNFTEPVTATINTASSATNISTLVQDIDVSGGMNDSLRFQVQTGDNGQVTPSVDFDISDPAGNVTNITSLGTINGGHIYTDTIAPELSTLLTRSDNPDPAYARTGNTIYVCFNENDASLPIDMLDAQMMGADVTSSFSMPSSTSPCNGYDWEVKKFTVGTEAEGSVQFQLHFWDLAGNENIKTQANITNPPNVIYDRSEPVITGVWMESESMDSTAYMGDVPTYYAKNNDRVKIYFEGTDAITEIRLKPNGRIDGKIFPGEPEEIAVEFEYNATENRFELVSGFITTDSSWREGYVTFEIPIEDMAGNTIATLTSTTNNSEVIYDRTIPINPTDVIDLQGREINRFKHRIKANYTWTNDHDDTINTTDISGIQNYKVRFINNQYGLELHKQNPYLTARSFDGRISDLSPWDGERIPPRDDRYELWMITVDKAGNPTAEELVYEQFYTIGVYGVVTGPDGNPLPGVSVQVAARFGFQCDKNQEVCTDVTNQDGEYGIVVKKDQDYNITFYHPMYFLRKNDIHVAQDDYTENTSLNFLTSPHQAQTHNQTVRIGASAKWTASNGQIMDTVVYASSLSGEITVTQKDGYFEVKSLSRISRIWSNNPNVTFVPDFEGVYKVYNAGSAGKTTSFQNMENRLESGEDIHSRGEDEEYRSGESWMGVAYNPGSGKANRRMPGEKREDHVEKERFISYEESMADAMKDNDGIPRKVLTYTNRNGYKIFRGYQHGKLPLERLKGAQIGMQNQVLYRGERKKEDPRLPIATKEHNTHTIQERAITPENFQEKYEEMKHKYQREYAKETSEPKKARFKSLRQEDAYLAVLTKKEYDENKVNKWERHENFHLAPSRMEHRTPEYVNIRVRGKSIDMTDYLQGTRR